MLCCFQSQETSAGDESSGVNASQQTIPKQPGSRLFFTSQCLTQLVRASMLIAAPSPAFGVTFGTVGYIDQVGHIDINW